MVWGTTILDHPALGSMANSILINTVYIYICNLQSFTNLNLDCLVHLRGDDTLPLQPVKDKINIANTLHLHPVNIAYRYIHTAKMVHWERYLTSQKIITVNYVNSNPNTITFQPKFPSYYICESACYILMG